MISFQIIHKLVTRVFVTLVHFLISGFTEVACSRNIEICEGQTIFLHCTGNMAATVNNSLQLNFFAFRENRLPFTVHVVDSNEPMKMKLAVILNPRRDQHGRVHAACALDINLSTDVSSLVLSS